MRTNVPSTLPPVTTHEGGPARHISAFSELRRLTLSALLFEDTFYEKGATQADRIRELVSKCKPFDVARLAVECRSKMHLRHMPLFLVRELARITGCGSIVATALEQVIQRPDELAEYLALYWRDGRCPVSAGSKRGLVAAFKKFDAETLAKYARPHAVKLRDVLRLVHAKPDTTKPGALFPNRHIVSDPKTFVFDGAQATGPKMIPEKQYHTVRRHREGQGFEWGQLIKGELPAPDTWEVALSAGGDKKATFERLLREKKLGGLAFLRNLRNMIEARVSFDLMKERFAGGFGRVLPFRFVAAMRHAPQFVRELDAAMQRCLADMAKIPGTTVILVDVSGSMDDPLSAKSDMKRVDVASGLAVLVAAVAERVRVFTFSERLVEVPPFKGLALVDAIRMSQSHSSTLLGAAVQALRNCPMDRLIIITDEQSRDHLPIPTGLGYVINVAANRRGVGYGPWIHIDGFSERVLDFVQAHEADNKEAR